MAKPEVLRVVSKAHYDQQYFVEIPPPKNPLANNSIRVRTRLTGISANNMTYCLMGDFMHWWSAYRVPDSAPVPYNDSSKYGIGPGWGYCEVLDSTIENISPGSFVTGFLPISAHTVDLQLEALAAVPGHFIETSPGRSKLANLYRRYEVMPASFNLDTTFAGWSAVLKVYESGSSIARYLLPQDGRTPIHPLGDPNALGPSARPWTGHEANVDGACIVCLGSGSKTARAFLYQLAKLAESKPPSFGVVEVASSKAGCRRYLKNVPFPHQVVGYDLAEGLPKHQKYITVNFGGRANSLESALDAAKQANANAEIICLQVGSEAKVFTAEDMARRRALLGRIKPWQMNATGVRDAVMAEIGERAYFTDLNNSFTSMVQEQERDFEGRVLGLELSIKHGIKGDDGVEGVWSRLCSGQFRGDEGVVVRLDY